MKPVHLFAGVTIASALALSSTASAQCDVPTAFTAAYGASNARVTIDLKRVMAASAKLAALSSKAKGGGPIGDYLTPVERQRFDALADDLTLWRLRYAVESTRQRHIELLQRMDLLAGRNWLKSEIITEKTDADFAIQGVLLLIQNNYKEATVAAPGAGPGACSIGDGLAYAQEFMQTLSSGNGAHAVPDNVASYLVAVELIKKMNTVSETLYRLDMADAVPASKGSADIASVMGSSASTAIASGRVDRETAEMMKAWRWLDDQYPSDAVRQSGVLDAHR